MPSFEESQKIRRKWAHLFPVVCPKCGGLFDSSAGLAIHEGKRHVNDEVPS